MRFRFIVLAAATTLGLSLLAVPGIAAAQTDPPDSAPAAGETSEPVDWLPEEGVLGLQSDDDAASERAITAQTYPSPSQCRGRSNNPHQSTTPRLVWVDQGVLGNLLRRERSQHRSQSDRVASSLVGV